MKNQATSYNIRVVAPEPPAQVSLNTGWQLQDQAKTPSAGADLSRPGYHPVNWYKATVPGTVLTSLVSDGVYPEPLYGENNRPDKIPDSLCRTSYWYRKQFTVAKSYAGRRVFLNFAGINYTAQVWLNGRSVGSIRGAFSRGRFDITPLIKADGKTPSAVAVLIQPPPHSGTPLEQTTESGTGKNGGILAEDGATFLCTIGWDWIPGIRDRDMGLWQGVSLTSSGSVTIHDPYVTSDLPLPSTATADLTLRTTLRNETGQTEKGVLIGSCGDAAAKDDWIDGNPYSFSRAYTLQPHATRDITLTDGQIPQFHVTHPRLWWPNGYGPQNLYRMRLIFLSATGEFSDVSDTTFGIRKIAYVYPRSGNDNLTLVVNGVPVVAKGGDWGMDEAMKRAPYARLDAEIRMHKLANYTIIRNWVGQSTSEDFYDLCDKYGILVWDEFFQPNPSDGPNPLDLPMYTANVREKILRYRSHPCIALWCGRNEGFPPPEINDTLSAMLAKLDPTRRYQPSSTDGNGVHSGGPYHWRAPRAYYDVDAPFKTEIGSVSIPTLEAVHAMMPAKDWNQIGNDDWAEHDLCWGAQQGDLYPAIIAARYGKTDTLADFVREAQMADYESYRAMYEGRLCQLFHPTSGVITWMSAPAQPSAVWQLYSYDLEPDAALFAVRHACEPLHVMLNESNNHVEVVNNTAQAIGPGASMRVIARVYSLDGKQITEFNKPLDVAASSVADLGTLTLTDGFSGLYFVRVMLQQTSPVMPDKLVSDNFYWRTNEQPKPLPKEFYGKIAPDLAPAYIAAAAGDDLTGLNQLATVTLDIHARRHDAGAKCFLDVTVRNPSQIVALMTHLQLRRARSNARILPVYYSDNYISLVPGETKTLTVECAKSDLRGEAPALAVDGWNVTVMTASTAGAPVQVMPNDEAMVPGEIVRQQVAAAAPIRALAHLSAPLGHLP